MTKDQQTWLPSYPPTLPPAPIAGTSNASGLETSRGDGLALGDSPLRIAPTHTIKSNPPFLCVLLSLGVLRVPIVYGFCAPKACFVITMNQSLHANTVRFEEEGGSVRGQETSEGDTGERCLTSPWEPRCPGWSHPEADAETRVQQQVVRLEGDPGSSISEGETKQKGEGRQ